MWLWELLAVGAGKEFFTRKGKKEEATGQTHLVSGPEPPPSGFLILPRKSCSGLADISHAQNRRYRGFVDQNSGFHGSEVDDGEILKVRMPRSTRVRLNVGQSDVTMVDNHFPETLRQSGGNELGDKIWNHLRSVYSVPTHEFERNSTLFYDFRQRRP